jgi:hypothetical protein
VPDDNQKYILIDGKQIIPVDTKEPEPEETPLDLNPQIAELIQNFVSGKVDENKGFTPIHVDDIAISIAKFYELLRKVVDWKEDAALRRSAIERILKRLLFSKVSGISPNMPHDPGIISETVASELIRGGHLPNDEVPREYVDKTSVALAKYLVFLESHTDSQKVLQNVKDRINFVTFLIEIMACEIEDILSNPVKEKTIIMGMTKLIHDRIKIIPSDAFSPDEVNAQIFIAVCRTLYDLDSSYITYHLLRFQYPFWQNPDPDQLQELNSSILSIWKQSDQVMNHPLSKNLYNICERVDTVFSLIDDFFQEYKDKPSKIQEIMHLKSKFTEHVSKYYEKRYTSLKKRLFRLAIFSTLSVFASNWFTFFVVEIPLAHLFSEGFNGFTAFMDFLIPTLVMFILVAIIRAPGLDNYQRVLTTLYDFVYKDEKQILFDVHVKRNQNQLLLLILVMLYLAITLIVFGAVAYIFIAAGLPITSVIFDTFTIALTVFAAVTIRNKSKELSVNDKTGFFEFLLDMFSVPVAKVGSFLAAKWKEYNVIAIFFSVVIETPFNLIIKFVEGWSEFLKERRAELH